MLFYKINFCLVRVFRLYTAYNKHEMIKIGDQTREKIASIIARARIILLPTVTTDRLLKLSLQEFKSSRTVNCMYAKPSTSKFQKFAIKFHRSTLNVQDPALNSLRRYDARMYWTRKRPRIILTRENDFVPRRTEGQKTTKTGIDS